MAVQMSPEVEEALGPQMALQARAVTDGTCIECRQPLESGPVNVVLAQSTVATAGVVQFAHAACAPSRIVPIDREATEALVEPEGGFDMVMTPGLVEGEPVLVAEMAMQLTTDSGTPGSEPRSIFMQALLENGFHLITHELDAPILKEWVAVFAPHGRDLQLLILAPDASKFFHGIVTPPPGWIKAVLARKQVLLLAGDVGLGRRAELQKHRESVVAAARAGKLAGARLVCGRATDYGLA